MLVERAATVKPGVPFSTRNIVIDWLGAPARLGLRRDAIKIGVDAVGDEHLGAVEHVLIAVAPSDGADALTSEPASGSVTATAVMTSPAMIRGIHWRFCAALPALKTWRRPCRCGPAR